MRAARVVEDRLRPLLDEVRGSLDYYLGQGDALPVSRVLLTGGGSLLRGLPERLQGRIGIPVDVAHPLLGLRIGDTGLSEAQLVDAEPVLAVPVGLALGGVDQGGRRLSLLPGEVRAVRRERHATRVLTAGIGAFALVLLAVWLAQGWVLSRERHRAQQAENQAADLQRQVNALQGVATLQAQLEQRRQLAGTVMTGDVAWGRLLQQVAGALPDDVWLTSFTGSSGGGAGGSTAGGAGTARGGSTSGTGGAATSGGGGGKVVITAMGSDQGASARWLSHIAGSPPSATHGCRPRASRVPARVPS